jgi:hypothetical protein
MANYDADKFADWLTDAFARSTFKSYSALADSVGLSRSTVSALAGAKKQPLTDKPSQPKSDTVVRLANALNENIDKVLGLAGYAPQNGIDIDDGLFRMMKKLPPGKLKLAKRQIAGILESLSEDGEDFDYIDDK